VQLDVQVGAPDHFGRERPRDALRLGAIGAAREHAVQVLAIEGVHERHALLERRHVREPHQDDGARHRRGVESRAQPLRRQDRRVLEAVHAGRQRQHAAGPHAVEHGDEHRRGGIGGPGRHDEIEIATLARGDAGAADDEGGAAGRGCLSGRHGRSGHRRHGQAQQQDASHPPILGACCPCPQDGADERTRTAVEWAIGGREPVRRPGPAISRGCGARVPSRPAR
jgi:hypothetical protein